MVAYRKSLVLAGLLLLTGTSWMMLDKGPERPPENDKLGKLKLQPGFRAEHLYSPSDHQQGSWVSMAFDARGRLITSDQYGFCLLYTSPSPRD